MSDSQDKGKPSTDEARRARPLPAVSLVLPDGRLVETVHDPHADTTQFCVGDGAGRSVTGEVTVNGERRVPYSPHNNLLRHRVVLLPSDPEPYGSPAALLGRIQAFIHRYVDLSPVFEQLATSYVLLTWLYDRFNELPYLRVRGDAGSGKTRFLLIVGSLCYKPIFASGASTVSPLFRILDSFRGTLILDESDFRVSDERAEVVKILNNGNARGFPVLRSEQVDRREFDPRAYAVFGPKLIATRGFFDDRALESRCLTEELGQGRLRTDIPINLPDTWVAERGSCPVCARVAVGAGMTTTDLIQSKREEILSTRRGREPGTCASSGWWQDPGGRHRGSAGRSRGKRGHPDAH